MAQASAMGRVRAGPTLGLVAPLRTSGATLRLCPAQGTNHSVYTANMFVDPVESRRTNRSGKRSRGSRAISTSLRHQRSETECSMSFLEMSAPVTKHVVFAAEDDFAGVPLACWCYEGCPWHRLLSLYTATARNSSTTFGQGSLNTHFLLQLS